MDNPAPPTAPASGHTRPGRVLFVDIDGVFHPTTHSVASTEPAIDAVHFGWVHFLDRALRGHDDVVIVVHSTWRKEYTLEELRELLGVLGPRVVALTPLESPRYESIQWWLHMNPSFSDYRILDDQPHEFPDPPPPEFILCNPATGVTAPKVLQALSEWLGAAKGRTPGKPK